MISGGERRANGGSAALEKDRFASAYMSQSALISPHVLRCLTMNLGTSEASDTGRLASLAKPWSGWSIMGSTECTEHFMLPYQPYAMCPEQ